MPAAAVPQVEEEVAPVIAKPTTRRARVKGTWTMFYGEERFDFIDGQSYDLSHGLFDYLRSHGNIYDTMA